VCVCRYMNEKKGYVTILMSRERLGDGDRGVVRGGAVCVHMFLDGTLCVVLF
jgi:hypothetical protein